MYLYIERETERVYGVIAYCYYSIYIYIYIYVVSLYPVFYNL